MLIQGPVMDPLSVTASIIAVITAVSAVLKTLEHIKSRSDNGSVLITVINIVSGIFQEPCLIADALIFR